MSFLKRLADLQKDKVNLMVMHVAEATPEMNALVDMNNTDQYSETKPLVAMHRSAELNTYYLPNFQKMIKDGKVKISYLQGSGERAGIG
jgi:hypothetical protein